MNSLGCDSNSQYCVLVHFTERLLFTTIYIERKPGVFYRRGDCAGTGDSQYPSVNTGTNTPADSIDNIPSPLNFGNCNERDNILTWMNSRFYLSSMYDGPESHCCSLKEEGKG